jgi:hypothetical protein
MRMWMTGTFPGIEAMKKRFFLALPLSLALAALVGGCATTSPVQPTQPLTTSPTQPSTSPTQPLTTSPTPPAQPLKAFRGNPHATISGVPKHKVLDQLIGVMLSNHYELRHYKFLRGKGYVIQFSRKAQNGLGIFPSSHSLPNGPASSDLSVEYEVSEGAGELRISAKVVEAGSRPSNQKSGEFINAENHRIQSILTQLKASLGRN